MGDNNHFDSVIRKHPAFNSANRCNLIELLYPPFAHLVLATMYECRAAGIELGVFETFRSQVRQLRMFNEGRSGIKTNGMHYYGVACDLVPKIGGQWEWEVGQATWKKIGSVGKKNALSWGGDWKRRVDSAHFQAIPVADQPAIRKLIYPVMPPVERNPAVV